MAPCRLATATLVDPVTDPTAGPTHLDVAAHEAQEGQECGKVVVGGGGGGKGAPAHKAYLRQSDRTRQGHVAWPCGLPLAHVRYGGIVHRQTHATIPES